MTITITDNNAPDRIVQIETNPAGPYLAAVQRVDSQVAEANAAVAAAEGFRDEAESFQNAALVTTYEYTATAGQTVFTGADLNGNVLAFPDQNVANVSRNGTFVDFSTTGTNTVTLDSAAGAGDEIRIPVYGRWTVGDIENPARYYSTWAALKAAVDAGATFTAGQVVFVGQIPSGKMLAFVAQTGATDIPALPGLLPAGAVSPLHFAENTTPGTTDMTAAVQAAVNYAGANGLEVTGLSAEDQIAISSGILLPSGSDSVSFDHLHLVAIGTWADDADGYSSPMLRAFDSFDVEFRNVILDANWKASCLLIESCQDMVIGSRFKARRWANRADDMSYGVRTKTKAGQLAILARATAQQYLWADPGFDRQVNRTGYGWKIETADFSMESVYAYYTKYPVHVDSAGSYHITAAHLFNGALDPAYVTNASAIWGLYIQTPRNGEITAPYMDNCTMFINGDTLHNGSQGLCINGGHGHKNANGSQDVALRISTAVASNNLAGLNISDFQLFDAAALALDTTGSGSYADLITGSFVNVATKVGGAATALGSRYSFRGLFRTITDGLRFNAFSDRFSFLFNKGLTIHLDEDDNSAGQARDLEIKSGLISILTVDDTSMQVNVPITASAGVRLPPVAVASLPTPASAGAGARRVVNNATSTTFNSIVAGGGANTVPVFSDGTNWRIG